MFLTVNDFVFPTSFFSNDALFRTSYETFRFHPPRYRGFRYTFASKTVSTNFILLKPLVFFTPQIYSFYIQTSKFLGVFLIKIAFFLATPHYFWGMIAILSNFNSKSFQLYRIVFYTIHTVFSQYFTRNRPFYIQIVSKNSTSITFRQKSATPPKFPTPTRKNTQNIQTPLHFYLLNAKTSKID